MDAPDRYRADSISTQDRGKLIVMLYEGAVKFLQIAKQKLAEGDYALKGVYIAKAQDIVSELNNCLDMKAAPDIAQNLRSLYNYIFRQLNEANIERSSEKIDTCIGILEELGKAWQEIASRPQVAVAGEASSRPGGGFTCRA
jgi:flagellar protein FliS